MTGRRRFLALAVVVLAACKTVDINVHTAASGTQIEARQVVGLVYGQAPVAEIDKLPYSGGDLSAAVKRIHGRYPTLKPWLDQGVVGNAPSGFIVLRDDSRRDELRELIRQENFDRALLYTQATVAVGHGTDNLNAWLPYASYSFGEQWIGQAPKGWWALDENTGWYRKQ